MSTVLRFCGLVLRSLVICSINNSACSKADDNHQYSKYKVRQRDLCYLLILLFRKKNLRRRTLTRYDRRLLVASGSYFFQRYHQFAHLSYFEVCLLNVLSMSAPYQGLSSLDIKSVTLSRLHASIYFGPTKE